MPLPELPTVPVVAWRESHTPWWSWPISLISWDGFERKREVSVSENGIGLGVARFVPWDDIVRVTRAPDPDLARIRLRDGTDLLLDRWHLPVPGDPTIKRERVELLQRALAASRPSEA